MSLFSILINLFFGIICVSHINGHQTKDFRSLVEEEVKPHIDSGGSGGPQIGEKPAIWTKYGDMDFMHDLK